MTKQYGRREIISKGFAAILGSYAFFQPSLDDIADTVGIPRGEYKSNVHILKKFFTKKAYELFKDIPLIVPPWFPEGWLGFAPDGSFLHSAAEICLGVEPGRKVLVSEELFDEEKKSLEDTLIHEYTHQGHRLGIINYASFLSAYDRCKKDSFSDLIVYTEENSKVSFLARLFGWPKDYERLAVLAEFIVKKPQSTPVYVHRCYSNLLEVSKNFVA